MDKRLIFCLGFVFVLLFVSTAYYVISGKKDTTREEKDTKDVLENSKKQNDNLIVDDGKVLVVYFSRAYENYNVGNVEIGNTAVMASYIIDYLRADSFEIVPLKEYPKDFICEEEKYYKIERFFDEKSEKKDTFKGILEIINIKIENILI